jgi:hypothetical protein
MDTQAKTVAEVRVYEFNFERQPEIRDSAEMITNVISLTCDPSGLTIGTPAIATDGKRVQVELSGGTLGTRYLMKMLVELDGGPKRLEMPGVLSVIGFTAPEV